jgi:hypothetical protein
MPARICSSVKRPRLQIIRHFITNRQRVDEAFRQDSHLPDGNQRDVLI